MKKGAWHVLHFTKTHQLVSKILDKEGKKKCIKIQVIFFFLFFEVLPIFYPVKIQYACHVRCILSFLFSFLFFLLIYLSIALPFFLTEKQNFLKNKSTNENISKIWFFIMHKKKKKSKKNSLASTTCPNK